VKKEKKKRGKIKKGEESGENKLKCKIYALMCINVFSLSLIFCFVEY
jgi:hypothetical protein